MDVTALFFIVVFTTYTLSIPPSSAVTFTDCPFHHLQHLESSVLSEKSGIDGIITAIFSVIGTNRKEYVNLSYESSRNIYTLSEIFGFNSVLGDNTRIGHMSTLEDIKKLLIEMDVPSSFDFLNVQFGMSSWWVLATVMTSKQQYRPRVIMTEVNSMLGCRDEVVPYKRVSTHFKLT